MKSQPAGTAASGMPLLSYPPHLCMPALPKSLPRICVALGFPSPAKLSQAAEHEYREGTTFFEFRLDHLTDPAAGIEVIRDFRRAHPDAYVLATCRSRFAKGQFRGGIEPQLAILKASAEAGATFVDVEIEIAEKVRSAVKTLREKALLIVSYHNFQNTPALDVIARRLKKVPADVYKIATTARKPTDNLRAIELLRQHERASLVVIAMTETGAASRILLPALGSLFTYAAPSEGEGTAPGQISAHALRSLYRPERLTKLSKVYGVIADPVAHSKSPNIHNRAFQARRCDAVYVPFLVKRAQLGDWMTCAVKLPVAGFSVTIPHKQRILRYLDVVDPLARRIGAVNTVWRRAGKWRGANTDAEGVLKPLSRQTRLANSSVLIAGYGGAARAAAVALTEARAHVTITGRSPARAQALARVIKGTAMTLKQAQTQHFDVLVHATPVGMSPKTDECLFPDQIPGDLVLDMVYNPSETLLLKRAKAQGCKVIPGSEMLLEQAVAQFEIWTGDSAPREVMRRALEPLR